jgi:hypothetical protein
MRASPLSFIPRKHADELYKLLKHNVLYVSLSFKHSLSRQTAVGLAEEVNSP